MTSDVLSEFAKGETATASDKAGDGPTPLIVEAVTILVSEIAAYTARIEAIAAEAYTPGSPLWPATLICFDHRVEQMKAPTAHDSQDARGHTHPSD